MKVLLIRNQQLSVSLGYKDDEETNFPQPLLKIEKDKRTWQFR